MKNTLKRIIALVLSVALFSGFSMEAKAAPAPGLTKVEITDLTVDDYGEIHVEVKFTGTPKNVFVYWEGDMLDENEAEQVLILNSSRIVVGYYKYYHTGLYYPQDALGQSMTIRVQATNAMSPWNTISRSRVFTLSMA